MKCQYKKLFDSFEVTETGSEELLPRNKCFSTLTVNIPSPCRPVARYSPLQIAVFVHMHIRLSCMPADALISFQDLLKCKTQCNNLNSSGTS